MKFPESWLRETVDIPVGREALLHRLTMGGLEVEGVDLLGAALDGVVVAEIVACEPHPDAERLRICRVATTSGSGNGLAVVCGAPNARVGLKVALATVGSKLAGGNEIRKAVLRGVESSGMLCSASELGIGDGTAGIVELPDDAPVGEPLATYLGLPDATIEIKLTPNRPDCLSVHGLARDAAALFASVFVPAQFVPVGVTVSEKREIRIESAADCPRYLGRVIEGFDATATSPHWLRERLRRSGLRSISAVVDVTNYVMLELGQPLHAFDNDRLQGSIVVRRAIPQEKITLLDASEHVLTNDFLVIADQSAPLALAGIMGGFDSRVTDTTRNIFLESAHFSPAALIGRGRKLGLHTDASHRFERGVDPELPRVALERASALLIAIAGGNAGPVIEAVHREALPPRASIELRRMRMARVLDLEIPDAEVERILTALGLVVEATASGWRATVPSWRFDLAIEEDLIEEVVRIHGYERVPTHPPRGDLAAPVLPEAILGIERLRAQLVARDYAEAVCYAFIADGLLNQWGLDAGAVALANPLSGDLAVMRTSLLPGLVNALLANRRRQQERVRLFEVGKVFHRDPGSAGTDRRLDSAPVETLCIAGVVCGSEYAEQWGEIRRSVDFFDLKGDVESLLALTNVADEFSTVAAVLPWLHPGQAAQLKRGERHVGFLGALHPDLLGALDIEQDVFVFELDVDAVSMRPLPSSSAISRFPSVRRDLSFELSIDVPYARVEAAVRDAIGETLSDVVLFDLYAAENLGTDIKSLAIGLILQERCRTLTDQDADRYMALAVAALESVCKAKLRG